MLPVKDKPTIQFSGLTAWTLELSVFLLKKNKKEAAE